MTASLSTEDLREMDEFVARQRERIELLGADFPPIRVHASWLAVVDFKDAEIARLTELLSHHDNCASCKAREMNNALKKRSLHQQTADALYEARGETRLALALLKAAEVDLDNAIALLRHEHLVHDERGELAPDLDDVCEVCTFLVAHEGKS